MEHLGFKTVIKNLKVPKTHGRQRFLTNKEMEFFFHSVFATDLGYSDLA